MQSKMEVKRLANEFCATAILEALDIPFTDVEPENVARFKLHCQDIAAGIAARNNRQKRSENRNEE